jgi:SnoaL-like domain
MTKQVQASENNAKQVVLELGNAINAEDFQLARKYVSDDMKHIYPLGTHDNAEVYFQQLEQIRPKFDILKTFVDGNEVCVLYDTTASGVKLSASGWFKVKDGKVRSLTVVFDPRPLLAVWGPNK